MRALAMLDKLPIQRKLLLIILGSNAISLFLVMIGVMTYELTSYRSRLSDELSYLGSFIAANSAPTLAFDDPRTAQQIINTLESSPAVAVAALYTADGRVFASFVRPNHKVPSSPPLYNARQGLRFTADEVELVRSVSTKGRTLGTVYLSGDLSSMYDRMKRYAGILAVVALAISGGSFLLQKLLQRLISVPLLELANAAESIAAGDLSTRFPVRSSDEIGQLGAAFNHMTSQLAQSNEALREREEQLKRSEMTLLLAIEATGLGTFDYYPRTGELIWSDRIKRHFGLAPGTPASYQTFVQGLHPDDRERVQSILQKAFEPGSGGTYSAEYRTVGIEDGKLRWITARGKAFFDEAGEAVRLIGTTLDITERKEAEIELRTAKTELELRVMERTRELEEAYANLHHETDERLSAMENLRRNEQLLMQQSRLAAMGEMLGNIAHQWRQPLNNLGLILQYLPVNFELGELTQKHLEETVAKAMQLILHMSHTIDDFSTFLQPDKATAEFSLNDAVATTISLFEATLKTMEVVVEVRETERLLVQGRRNEFSQVLLNLITNARDAFKERGTKSPKLEIELFKENGKAVVTMTDNAGGISEGILTRIFDPYFTTKGPDKGTGIGLFMSKNIIEKSMNGSLTVRNTGEGAQFRIEV